MTTPLPSYPLSQQQLEQYRGWCASPLSQEEFGYDCARYLLGQVDWQAAEIRRLRAESEMLKTQIKWLSMALEELEKGRILL